jgi:hypothetical protein
MSEPGAGKCRRRLRPLGLLRALQTAGPRGVTKVAALNKRKQNSGYGFGSCFRITESNPEE